MQIFSEDLSDALDLNDKSDMLKYTGRKEEIQRLFRAAVVTADKTFQSEQLKLKEGTVKDDGKTLTSEQERFLKVNVHDHIGADIELQREVFTVNCTGYYTRRMTPYLYLIILFSIFRKQNFSCCKIAIFRSEIGYQRVMQNYQVLRKFNSDASAGKTKFYELTVVAESEQCFSEAYINYLSKIWKL
jgi:hypothetical protein